MDAKKAMLIQLERDKCERLGVAFDESKFWEVQKQKAKKPPLEMIQHGIKTIKTLYTEDRQPGVAKTCFKTICVYTSNVLKDPSDPKYQSINLENKAFQNRVGKIQGGRVILQGFGFEEEDGKLVLQKFDQQVFEKGVALLQNE